MASRIGYYDGAFYQRAVEPRLRGLHRMVVEGIPPGATVIDLCCGTGALAVRLAEKASRVVGVDLSQAMIDRAEAVRRRHGAANLLFTVGDCARLDTVEDETFDWATVVMGLHEMDAEARSRAAAEVARVARSALIVDFAVPLPWNRAGLLNRAIEVMAGPRHFNGFLEYQRRGGLAPLLREAGLSVTRHGRADAGSLDLYTVRCPGRPT